MVISSYFEIDTTHGRMNLGKDVSGLEMSL